MAQSRPSALQINTQCMRLWVPERTPLRLQPYLHNPYDEQIAWIAEIPPALQRLAIFHGSPNVEDLGVTCRWFQEDPHPDPNLAGWVIRQERSV